MRQPTILEIIGTQETEDLPSLVPFSALTLLVQW